VIFKNNIIVNYSKMPSCYVFIAICGHVLVSLRPACPLEHELFCFYLLIFYLYFSFSHYGVHCSNKIQFNSINAALLSLNL
jgi:hypothetical protein